VLQISGASRIFLGGGLTSVKFHAQLSFINLFVGVIRRGCGA